MGGKNTLRMHVKYQFDLQHLTIKLVNLNPNPKMLKKFS